MNKPKFTKGPWELADVTFNGKHVQDTWCVGVNGCSLAQVSSGPTFGVVDEIQRANAALIATAPEMYDLLNELLEKEYVDTPTATKIKTVLAKARG